MSSSVASSNASSDQTLSSYSSHTSPEGEAEAEASSGVERVQTLACQSAVVVFSVSSCCMCHVVKRLFCSLGVGPAVYELDELEEGDGEEVQRALEMLVGDGKPPLPAVFVGGKLVGGLESLMAAHIGGALVPLLKQAGALWL